MQSMAMGKTERKLPAAAFPVAVTLAAVNAAVLCCTLVIYEVCLFPW